MTLVRPFPGVRFRAEKPAVITLPRMDIAALVGFAERGPVNTPVLIEDLPRFREIFGGVVRLAWDADAHRWQTACLAGAVADFFAQGGQRCWVVRVAGDPAINLFPVTGVLAIDGTASAAAYVAARSRGSWSDRLEVRANLLVEPLAHERLAVLPGSRFTGQVQVGRGAALLPGDLLQLDFSDTEQHRAYVRVDRADPVAQSAGLAGRSFDVEGAAYWFRPIDTSGTLTGTLSTSVPAGYPIDTAVAHLDNATLTLHIDSGWRPAPGSWLRFSVGGQETWLLVQDLVADDVQLAGTWWTGANTADLLEVNRVQRVTLALTVREGATYQRMIEELGFAAGHPRFCGALPTDEALFALTAGLPEDPAEPPDAALRQEVAFPRFPLAGFSGSALYLPLGLNTPESEWMAALPLDGEPLQRDGLVPPGDPLLVTPEQWAQFLPDLFLDPELRLFDQRALLAEAFDRRFIQNEPLTGLHSMLPLDEVSLLALPDAAQRGWRLEPGLRHVEPPSPPPPPPPEECPKDSPFQAALELADEPPAPEPVPAPDTPRPTWVLFGAREYDGTGLIEVQRRAVELAAARADMATVLSLPQHFRAREVMDYRRDLDAIWGADDPTPSYAALYHPWLVERDQYGDLAALAPDGAACGVIAARSIARGAWVPPANQIVRQALALTPLISRDDHEDLYNAGLNLIVSSARGFTVWGASTLTGLLELIPLSVRRLLIVLRRVALREGQLYVFAPHSLAFRRRVALSLERRLAALFARGAFAGSDPSQAYRVVVDDTVNTPSSVEQGRFIVELRVAPSQPLTFVTVRLIQTESDVRVVEEM